MNRRNLFRFIGLAAVAAVVPVSAQSTESDWHKRADRILDNYPRNPYPDESYRKSLGRGYLVHLNLSNGRVEKRRFYSREIATKYAMRTCFPKGTIVTVWGSFEEGCVLRTWS